MENNKRNERNKIEVKEGKKTRKDKMNETIRERMSQSGEEEVRNKERYKEQGTKGTQRILWQEKSIS